jgi:hypothetical protein
VSTGALIVKHEDDVSATTIATGASDGSKIIHNAAGASTAAKADRGRTLATLLVTFGFLATLTWIGFLAWAISRMFDIL